MNEYKPGDPRPEGYLQVQEWAKAQQEAGIKQSACPRCLRWFFPQEMIQDNSVDASVDSPPSCMPENDGVLGMKNHEIDS
jgi:hypothetical protein